MTSTEITRIFAYGTLKRGQCRDGHWPYAPTRVLDGTVRGELYDLGPYPAMKAGSDHVAGEIWEFRADQMLRTLQVLDEIEGFDDNDNDLYKRVIVNCESKEGLYEAFTYLYVPEVSGIHRVISYGEPCSWPNRPETRPDGTTSSTER